MSKQYLSYILLAGITIAISLFNGSGDGGASIWYGFFKAATTAFLIYVAVFAARALPKLDYLVLLAALLFCLGGDVALLWQDGFIYGLSSFLIGHILFVVLFVRWAPAGLNWGITLCVFGGTATYFVFLFPHLGQMTYPVSVYVTVISTMVAWALSYHKTVNSTASGFVAVGAVCFALSDSILAYNRFVSGVPFASLLVLATYWLSLLLIVHGAINNNTAKQ